MICIEIEVADDGKVTVGVCPPEEETAEGKSYMQLVGSVDEALQAAKDLLTNPQAAQANEAPMDPQREQAAANDRFNQIRGGMPATPGMQS